MDASTFIRYARSKISNIAQDQVNFEDKKL